MRILSPAPALFSLILFVALPANAQSAQPSTAQTSASASTIEQELVFVVRARTNAFASGDCQTYATFIDNDFRNIEGAHTATRKEILEECQQEARPLPGRKIERLVSDFHVQLVGNIALVDYVYEFREHYGEVVLNLASHNVDTFEKCVSGELLFRPFSSGSQLNVTMLGRKRLNRVFGRHNYFPFPISRLFGTCRRSCD